MPACGRGNKSFYWVSVISIEIVFIWKLITWLQAKKLADKIVPLIYTVASYVSAFVLRWLFSFSNMVIEIIVGWMVKGFFVVHEFAQRLSTHRIFLAAVKVLVTALFREKRFQSACLPEAVRRVYQNGCLSAADLKWGVWWWYQRPCLWKHHYLHVTPQSLPIVRRLPPPTLFPSPPVLISRICPSSLSQPA